MVRNYRPDSVAKDSLERILAAATRGPSAGHSQGVTLVVVENAERRRAIASLAGEDAWVAKGYPAWLSLAPVHVLLCAEPQIYRSRYSKADKRNSRLASWSIPFWYVDAGAALMLLLLACVEEGLAAGFQGGQNLPGVGDFLGIPTEVELLGLITLGYPAPDVRSSSIERGRRPVQEAIRRENWTNATPPHEQDVNRL
jgi:nitroreductase